MQQYNAVQWLLIFYLYCTLGWVWETTIVSVKQRRYVNRGFLRGPMLPIYGFGACMLLGISLPLHGHPVAMFFASMIVATVFEYLVGVTMEKLFQVRYWDYSEHRFQFQGYVCLQSSVCWGVLGLLLADFIHRPVNAIVTTLPFGLAAALAALWSATFLGDVVVSVRTALDVKKLLIELDKLREQGEELRRRLSESALQTVDALQERATDAANTARERVDEWQERAADAAENTREGIQKRLDALQQRFERAAGEMKRTRRGLLRGNPTMRSSRYDATLQKLKKYVSERRR